MQGFGNEVDVEGGCMYVIERLYTIAGEWFEDNYVMTKFATCYNSGVGGVLVTGA